MKKRNRLHRAHCILLIDALFHRLSENISMSHIHWGEFPNHSAWDAVYYGIRGYCNVQKDN